MSDEPEDDLTVQRRHLHDAIGELPKLDPDLPDSCFLTGWVMVSTFIDPDGSKWWVTRRGTNGGAQDLMPWEEKGMLQHQADILQARTNGRELSLGAWAEDDDDGD